MITKTRRLDRVIESEIIGNASRVRRKNANDCLSMKLTAKLSATFFDISVFRIFLFFQTSTWQRAIIIEYAAWDGRFAGTILFSNSFA